MDTISTEDVLKILSPIWTTKTETAFPRDVAEMALAHTIQNKVEAAYRCGDFFDKRRSMMQEWSDYVNPQQANRAHEQGENAQ